MNGLDTEVPKWFQDASSWYSSEARVQENSLFNLRVQHDVLNLQQKKQEIENTDLTNKRLSQDLSTIPQWMRDHPTWQSRSDAPWPTALTPQGDRMLQEQRLRDSQSIQAETAVIATHDFATRVAKLRELDPESAGQFAPYISQRPSPDILRGLSIAEESAKLHQENVAEATRMNQQAEELRARQSGDEITTIFGPKGQTTKIAPAKPNTTESAPRTLDLGNNRRAVWMPGAKTLHVINDKDKTSIELTPSQMQNAVKDLKADDPRKQKVVDFLAETAVRQTIPSSTSPAMTPSNPAQSQPTQFDIDFLKKNPQLKSNFDKRFGAGSADKYLTK